MIPVQFDYAAPENLEDAVKLLNDNEGAMVIAGSHSLIAALKQGKVAPSLLVDLLKIPNLQGIRLINGVLEIGGMTTLDQIATSTEIQENLPALAIAAKSIGDPQIRNWQRIGDIFAYRDLASDLPAIALALGATFETVTVNGPETMNTEDLLTEAVQKDWMPMVISKINFPLVPGRGTAYQSLRHPASTYAICGIAAVIKGNQESVSQCRVAVAGALSYPIRLPQVEAAMEGKTPTPENIAAAAKLAAPEITTALATRKDLTLLSDLYASAEYRTHLIGVLTRRALTEAKDHLID